MKDRVKIALKRGTSGLLAVLLAVCLVGTPRAKAVVSEGALLGSIFGSLLVSMGYSWAADNMDVPTFGEALYKLTQEYDETNKDTGIQLIRDLNIAALTAGRPGTIQFNYAWVQAARSFAEWFEGKFFTGGNNSSVVYDSNSILHMNYTDSNINLEYPYSCQWIGSKPNSWRNPFTEPRIPLITPGRYCFYKISYDSMASGEYLYLNSCRFEGPTGGIVQGTTVSDDSGTYTYYDITQDMLDAGNCKIVMSIYIHGRDTYINAGESFRIDNSYGYVFLAGDGAALSAEKPQEVHYPDVAEDGSQVYEITVDGVTATDIEGIIQGAVDRILAGTAAIAGSIADAQTKPGEIVENPEIDPYKVGLSSVFPFCIPFDVYNMVTMFVAEPEAPHAEWTFTLPWGSQEYSVGWDLAAFDGVARVCRDMELVLFAVGLAVITYKVIKW